VLDKEARGAIQQRTLRRSSSSRSSTVHRTYKGEETNSPVLISMRWGRAPFIAPCCCVACVPARTVSSNLAFPARHRSRPPGPAGSRDQAGWHEEP